MQLPLARRDRPSLAVNVIWLVGLCERLCAQQGYIVWIRLGWTQCYWLLMLMSLSPLFSVSGLSNMWKHKLQKSLTPLAAHVGIVSVVCRHRCRNLPPRDLRRLWSRPDWWAQIWSISCWKPLPKDMAWKGPTEFGVPRWFCVCSMFLSRCVVAKLM